MGNYLQCIWNVFYMLLCTQSIGYRVLTVDCLILEIHTKTTLHSHLHCPICYEYMNLLYDFMLWLILSFH